MKYYKISGGILFALLSEIRITNENRSQRMNGHQDPCNNVMLLNALVSIVSNKYVRHDLGAKVASAYKNCEGQSGLGINKKDFIDLFNKRIQDDYHILLKKTEQMLQRCIINDEQKRKEFATKLLFCISKANNISEEKKFYYGDPTKAITKKEFLSAKSYDLPSLILALWHFLVTNVFDNKDGKDMFEDFFVFNSTRNENIFNQSILNDYNSTFTLTNCLSPTEEIKVEDINDTPIINNPLLQKYNTFINKQFDSLSKLKTILYINKLVSFYKIFVCNRVRKITDKSEDKEESLNNAYPKTLLEKYGHFITLTAPGGVGKSMFLRHMAIVEKYYENEKRLPKTSLIPIFIKLRNYKNNQSLAEYIFRRIKMFDKDLQITSFENDLASGKFLFLFDALDEVDTYNANEFAFNLSEFCDEYPQNYYIVSSRPSNIANSLQQFITLELMPFTIGQAKKFIVKNIEFGQETINSFISNLSEYNFKPYYSIDNNPLLLTLKFLIYSEKGKIIKNDEISFYQEAYETLYCKHDELNNEYNRKFKSELNMNEMQVFLEYLAYFTFYNYKNEFSYNDINEVVLNGCFSKYPSLNTRNIIDDLCDNLSILYRENGKYSFIHKNFHEFFTASFLSKQNESFFDSNFISRLESYTKTKRKLLKEEKPGFFFLYNQIDDVIFKLYKIRPIVADKYIILPSLSKLFDYEYTNDEDAIINFAINRYSKVYISYGVTYGGGPFDMSSISEIHSFIFDRICDNINYYDISQEDNLLTDIPSEFCTNEYYLYKTNDDGFEEPTDDINEAMLINGKPKTLGIEYTLDLEYLKKNKKKYYEIFMDLVYIFTEEYKKFKNLYQELLNEYK